MNILLIILIVIICALLVLVVLAQNPKGGGVSSGFSGTSQLMGVKKTGDFLEKLTWGFAVSLVVLCLLFNIVLKPADASAEEPATTEQPAPGANQGQGQGQGGQQGSGNQGQGQ